MRLCKTKYEKSQDHRFQKEIEVDSVQVFLSSKGYGKSQLDPIYGPEGVIYWYKKAPNTDSHQLVVRLWPPSDATHSTRFEFEMTYETQERIWVNTKYYGLRFQELADNLDRLEENLIRAILSLNGFPNTYDFDPRRN